MSDNVIYSVSSRSDMLEEPFLRKDVVYVIDQNAQSYAGGQVILETSALANSGKWASYSEAVLSIPLVLAFFANAATAAHGNISATATSFAMGLKNGFHQLIHSLTVDYNSTNVVQLTPYTNFYVSYKMMTCWSQDDLCKYGASINFFPDNSRSVRYQSAAAVDGIGLSNNRNAFGALDVFESPAAFPSLQFNDGYQKRLFNCGYAPNDAAVPPAQAGLGLILSAEKALATGVNTYQTIGAADETRVYYYNIIANIRLKDLHDFFDKIPLTKGAFLKMTFNLNVAACSILSSNGGAAAVLTVNGGTAGISQLSGATNPLMVSSNATGNSFPQGGGAYRLHMGMGVSSLSSVGSPSVSIATINHQVFRSCRLYVPLYTMAPSYEDSYLQMNPSKTIIYRDIYQFTVPGVAINAQVNNLLSNGITNPKALVVIPILNKAAGNNMDVAIDPIQSPFSTEPATTSFGAALTQFNVQVSGVNIFQSNVVYDWEMFNNELSRINAVNGGQTMGLTSGLLSEYDFFSIYRYYVVDLSRGLSSEDRIPKSIQLQCQNGCNKTLDLYTFIEYERKLTIDSRTGQVVQV